MLMAEMDIPMVSTRQPIICRRREEGSAIRVSGKADTSASSCSRRVAAARHEERLHLLVLENLHRRSRGAFALREREERLLHRATMARARLFL